MPLLRRPGQPSISVSGRDQMRQGLPLTPRSRVACTLCHLRLSRWEQPEAARLCCRVGLDRQSTAQGRLRWWTQSSAAVV